MKISVKDSRHARHKSVTGNAAKIVQRRMTRGNLYCRGSCSGQVGARYRSGEKGPRAAQSARFSAVLKFDDSSMKSYDDQVTYDLVGACVEVLEMSVEDVLHTFGEY